MKAILREVLNEKLVAFSEYHPEESPLLCKQIASEVRDRLKGKGKTEPSAGMSEDSHTPEVLLQLSPLLGPFFPLLPWKTRGAERERDWSEGGSSHAYVLV